jgi:UDP-N-acetylglucosamine 1-carboxyvinyltransferase
LGKIRLWESFGLEEDKLINSVNITQNMLTAERSVIHIWGQNPLSGEVKISGAKNSALVVMAGSLLCSSGCRLQNIPGLVDVDKMCQILEALGVKIERNGEVIDLDTTGFNCHTPPFELVSKLRAAFFAIGPILARLGVAKVPLPGGCSIGARPVELHLRGLQAMGAHVEIEHGIVNAYVKGSNKRLRGAKIYLDYPSVGATETLMMAATLADGETILENAAKEPEVVDLANFCLSMGAQIMGAGTDRITIVGVKELHSTEYSIIPDRIETATFLVAGAITNSEISVFPVVPEHLTAAIAKLKQIGANVVMDAPNRLRVIPKGTLKGTDIETLPYPAFPTDMQAQFMAMLAVSEGNSVITETVFENRLQHVAELNRMGANIRVKGNHAIIEGVTMLSGATVTATDLRASAALVLAGLVAHGKTTIQDLHHLDRGYDDLETKMRKLGAKIERVTVNADGEVVYRHREDNLKIPSLTGLKFFGAASQTENQPSDSEIIKSLNFSYYKNDSSPAIDTITFQKDRDLAEAITGNTFTEAEIADLNEKNNQHSLEYRKQILQESLDVSQVAKILGYTEKVVIDLELNSVLLSISDEDRLLFPICQFDNTQSDKLVNGLQEVLRALQISNIAKLSWLTSANPYLGLRTPIEALKQGQKDLVVREAAEIGVC